MLKFLKKIIKFDKNDIELIKNSKFFDEEYYRLEKENIKGDPCSDYYYKGWKEGKSPSFYFSNNFYLDNNKDVVDANINPLVHYLKFGKSEDRTIENDKGLNLEEVYEDYYDAFYFYKFYVCDADVKRVNLFLDCIDEDINNKKELFFFLLNFCKKYNYKLRIFYRKMDFSLFKKFLTVNNIVLPTDVLFFKINKFNYLEVGLNEKYVCVSWKCVRALLNTCNFNNNVYFYINSLDNLDKEEYYQLSNVWVNDKVCCLVEDESILKKIKKCKLKFKTNNCVGVNKNNNLLCCDFGKMFIVGVEILNYTFLNAELNPDDWKIVIVDNTKRNYKFHFDTDVPIRKVDKISKDANLLFVMSYDKKDINFDKFAIVSWVEEEAFEKKVFINIKKDDSIEKMSITEKMTFSEIDNYTDSFIKCVRKFNR